MGVDYFTGPLHCAHCGAPISGGAPTRLGIRRLGDELGPGTTISLRPGQPEHAGYVRISDPPDAGRPLRLLETWECAVCGQPNFAVVSIGDGVMRSMRPVALDHAALNGVHYVSRNLGQAYPAPGTVDDDVLDRIGALLAGAGDP